MDRQMGGYDGLEAGDAHRGLLLIIIIIRLLLTRHRQNY